MIGRGVCDMVLDLRRALFSEMATVQVGMLGVQGSALPFEPMVHLMAPSSPELWFLAEPDSDLVKAIEGSSTAAYCVTGRNHDLHACLTGPVRLAPDRRGLERVWSISAEAMFPGGLSNIDWTPLQVKVAEAVVWARPESAVVPGMEMILSTLQEQTLTDDKRQVLRF
ncbi:hypothetical protein HYN69_18010 (plasmid) [Gemmobacter aquarius]|uniref:General stress protein FMN-binding split barrel domain-containing protein n=2 Tax=Paragemmobacter aquarius TaxID=2169400 RepID=A0A2S0URV0_9RHOB|nr:hypothetical protein HYN69_18010 [Gemmobacter aquarius]